MKKINTYISKIQQLLCMAFIGIIIAHTSSAQVTINGDDALGDASADFSHGGEGFYIYPMLTVQLIIRSVCGVYIYIKQP